MVRFTPITALTVRDRPPNVFRVELETRVKKSIFWLAAILLLLVWPTGPQKMPFLAFFGQYRFQEGHSSTILLYFVGRMALIILVFGLWESVHIWGRYRNLNMAKFHIFRICWPTFTQFRPWVCHCLPHIPTT